MLIWFIHKVAAAGWLLQVTLLWLICYLLLIRIILFMTYPGWSWDQDPCTYRGTHSSTLPPPQWDISVFLHMQSETELLMGRWLWNVGIVGPGAENHIPVPQRRLVSLFNKLQVLVYQVLKGNGRWHSDWFDLCSGQNTTMTNPESKYNLFA